MKNYIYSTLLLFLISANVFGQASNWSVNENDFQYTMSFVSFVNVDGNTLSSENDKVAAFVNGECRGVTSLIYVASKDSYYAYLTVFSNENNETLSFKIYDSVNDIVKDVEKTKKFEINEHYGDLFQAYSFASPALSNNVEIKDFGFNNIDINEIEIEGSQITIYLDNGQSVLDLNAEFQLSPGANLYIGAVKQVSGSNSINFTEPIQFQILSEDQSILQQWTVTVISSTGKVQYYKKDAICYVGGVIKVLYSINEAEVTLLKEDVAFTTSIVNNGEVIFNNLEIGSYTVKVGGYSKEIKINLKG